MEQSTELEAIPKKRKVVKEDEGDKGAKKRKVEQDDTNATPTKRSNNATSASDAASPAPIYIVNLADTTTDSGTESDGEELAEGEVKKRSAETEKEGKAPEEEESQQQDNADADLEDNDE